MFTSPEASNTRCASVLSEEVKAPAPAFVRIFPDIVGFQIDSPSVAFQADTGRKLMGGQIGKPKTCGHSSPRTEVTLEIVLELRRRIGVGETERDGTAIIYLTKR